MSTVQLKNASLIANDVRNAEQKLANEPERWVPSAVGTIVLDKSMIDLEQIEDAALADLAEASIGQEITCFVNLLEKDADGVSLVDMIRATKSADKRLFASELGIERTEFEGSVASIRPVLDRGRFAVSTRGIITDIGDLAIVERFGGDQAGPAVLGLLKDAGIDV